MSHHSSRVGLALVAVVALGLAGALSAGDRSPPSENGPRLPAPGLDLPVDIDGDGLSTFSDRYLFNLWLAKGGSLAAALTRVEVVGDVLDLSGFFSSPDARLSADSAIEEGELEDVCKAHRDLLRGALAGNDGNADQADDFDDLNHGRKAFNNRKLHGLGSNGRSCADCHMASDSFQLSPANASARFAALLACRTQDPGADDPLFRAIDADDFRTNGESASDFTNLTVNGLVRIPFPLPPTLKLVDPATGLVTSETGVDVWRSIPSVLNVKLTGPDPGGLPWFRGPNIRGGYQLDARQATLSDQALGALIAHAEIRIPPAPAFLDDVAAFQAALFSSEGVRAMSEAIDRGELPPDPDPPLTEEEEIGKLVFIRACGHCHGGPGQSNPSQNVIIRFHNIQTQCPRPVDGINPATGLPFFPGFTGTPRWRFDPCPPSLARNTRLYEVTRPNGQVVRRATSDPGRSLLTGFASVGAGPPPLVPPAQDDWQSLDVPQVRNIRNTAPYFHNNSAATLDDLLDHYEELFKFILATGPQPPAPRPAAISTDGVNIDRPFTPEERPALMAYLLKI
jgi:mono/diheme cytochrome c family protein